MTTETAPLEAVVSADTQQPDDLTRLSTELAKINATDAHLATLLGEARLLADMGLPASTNEYENLHRFVMTAQKVRTGALKIGKEMAAPHKAVYDAIMGEAKRIGEKAKEAEDLTRPLKEQYERNLEQQKIDEQRARHERIVARMQSLMQLGMVSTGGQYIGYGVTIDGIEVEALPDEEWDQLYSKAEMAYLEQKKRDFEEAERLQAIAEQEEADRKAELKRQQDEADRIKAEQEKRQRELAEEAERLTQLRIDARVERLVGMGATLLVTGEITWNRQTIMFKQALGVATSDDFEKIVADFAQRKAQHELEITRMANREARLLAQGWEREGPFYSYNNRPDLTVVEIGNATEEEFERWIAEFEQWKSDKVQAENLTKIRTERILETGATLNPGGCLMWQGCIVSRQPELGAMSDDEFEAHLSTVIDFQKDKIEAAKQAAADEKAKQKADKERAKRLGKDKNLLHKFALSIGNLVFPEPENDESKALLTEFNQRRVALAEEFIERIRTL